MPSALQIITGALQEIGVLAGGASPQGADGDDALSVLNDLVDSLGTERLAMSTVTRTTKTLASGTASYTIGSGGDISLTLPLWIDDATLVVDTSATTPGEVPIRVLTDREYAEWPSKTLQAPLSRAVYFDHAWSAGLGRIYPLPIPSVGTTQLVLYTPGEPISQFSNLATIVTFRPGVRRMLRKNLAIELAPSYPAAVVTPLLLKQAGDSKSAFKSANVRPLTHQCDPGLVGPTTGRWSIETGSYTRP